MRTSFRKYFRRELLICRSSRSRLRSFRIAGFSSSSPRQPAGSRQRDRALRAACVVRLEAGFEGHVLPEARQVELEAHVAQFGGAVLAVHEDPSAAQEHLEVEFGERFGRRLLPGSLAARTLPASLLPAVALSTLLLRLLLLEVPPPRLRVTTDVDLEPVDHERGLVVAAERADRAGIDLEAVDAEQGPPLFVLDGQLLGGRAADSLQREVREARTSREGLAQPVEDQTLHVACREEREQQDEEHQAHDSVADAPQPTTLALLRRGGRLGGSVGVGVLGHRWPRAGRRGPTRSFSPRADRLPATEDPTASDA